jgi:hypothetical protein
MAAMKAMMAPLAGQGFQPYTVILMMMVMMLTVKSVCIIRRGPSLGLGTHTTIIPYCLPIVRSPALCPVIH